MTHLWWVRDTIHNWVHFIHSYLHQSNSFIFAPPRSSDKIWIRGLALGYLIALFFNFSQEKSWNGLKFSKTAQKTNQTNVINLKRFKFLNKRNWTLKKQISRKKNSEEEPNGTYLVQWEDQKSNSDNQTKITFESVGSTVWYPRLIILISTEII